MEIKELDIVILTEGRLTKHFETDEPIYLQPGQVGTVVMELSNQMFEVEFADQDGIPYAMETVPAKHLLIFHQKPVPVNL
jgi:superfamily II DNA/RNA helicase